MSPPDKKKLEEQRASLPESRVFRPRLHRPVEREPPRLRGANLGASETSQPWEQLAPAPGCGVQLSALTLKALPP